MLEEAPLPSDDEILSGTRDWLHAPPHRLAAAGVYFLTARCAEQRHLPNTPERRDWFLRTLFELSEKYGWRLEAWCVLSNHYHLVAHSPANGAASLGKFVRHIHGGTPKEMNRLDHTPGRTRLWQNYRETYLDLPRGYYARLNYVHNNAVYHDLVRRGADWPWTSAAAFEKAVSPAWMKTIFSFRFHQIAAADGE